MEGLIYSLIPPPGKKMYLRLVLLIEYHEHVIETAQKDVGHMAMSITLQRVQEHFRWPGMVGDIT